MKKLSVSLLSADFSDLRSEVKKIESASCIASLHFDVMDGVFVPNISFGFPVLDAVRKLTELPISAHLMISDPLKFVQKFIDSGIDEIFVHINHEYDYLMNILDICRRSRVRFGVALNPDEEISVNILDIIKESDSALIMSVYPGFAGQKFIPDVLKKVEILNQYDIVKKIDGGINSEIFDYARGFDDYSSQILYNNKYMENLRYIDEFVMGSYFFKNIDKFINK